MIKNFNDYINESKNYQYRGFDVIFHPEIGPGGDGRWEVPELYYFKFANQISKGFQTVSKLQCQEAIDRYYDLNQKYRPIE